MGAWEGLLGGFMDRKYAVEKQNYEQAIAAGEREQKIFSTLINSDDPEIAQMAMAGLLDSANPKKKKGGLRGWIGEVESSPYLSRIQALLQTPVTEKGSIQLPGEAEGMNGPIPGMPNVTPTITQPAGNQPAGMAPTSMVDAKTQASAPPQPMTYTQPPPIPTTTQRPRQAFMSPYDRAMQAEEAQNRGGVRGRVAGYMEAGGTREEALAIERARLRAGSAAGQTYAEGEIVPDTTSPTGYSQILYLRADPTQTIRQPAMPKMAGSTRAANEPERIAFEMFGRPGEDPRTTMTRITPEEMAEVSEIVRTRATAQVGDEAQERAMRTALAEAAAPLSRMDAFQATQSLRDDWLKVSTPLDAVRRQLGVLAAAEQAINRGDTPAGSEAIIVTFEKMLDSLSVVRESEYLRPAFNQSLYEQVAGYIARLREGGASMRPEVLRTYVRLARDIGSKVQVDHQKHRTAIERTAQTAGIDPANIFGTMPPQATPPPTPQAVAPPSLAPNPSVAPPPVPATTGSISVTAPDGSTHLFQDQASADRFRAAIAAAAGSAPAPTTSPPVVPRPNPAAARPVPPPAAAPPVVPPPVVGAPAATPPPRPATVPVAPRASAPPVASTNAPRTVSPAGLALLKQREGFVPTTYQDSGGRNAIGYGFSTWKGQPVTPGMRVTQAEADEEMLRQIATTYAPIVDSVLQVPVSQAQYDALISLMWNHPATAKAVARKLNAGQPVTQDDFMVSATVNGRSNRGLQNRRAQEFAPFQQQR